MLSQPARMLALRRVPAFAGLDDSALAGLQVCLRWREFGTGERLYRQGEAGESLAIVASGALVVRVSLQRGGEYELGRVTAGGMVGEMVCVDPAPRSATVVAAAPTVIAELSRDGLTGLRGGAPKVYAAVMRAVIQVVGFRLREMNRRIDDEQGGPAAEPSMDRPTLDSVSMDRPSMDRPTLDRLSVNRLSVNRLSVNRLSVNRLSVDRLSVDRLSMDRPSMARESRTPGWDRESRTPGSVTGSALGAGAADAAPRSSAGEASKKRDGFLGLIDKLLGT